MTYEILASATNHPDPTHPYRGLYNHRSLDSLAKHPNCSLTAFAPIPYAPPVGPKSEFSRIPVYEPYTSYGVIRPRFVYWLPKSIFYSMSGRSLKRSLEKAVSSVDFDIAHACHIYLDGYALSSIADVRNKPVTVTCHGAILNNYPNLPPFVSDHIDNILQQADHIFCVSRALTNKAKRIGDRSDVSTAPLGADPSDFPVERREKLRSKHQVSNEALVVLFCGQFIERKGIRDIIRVLPDLPDHGVVYVFIGHGGEMKSQLIEASKSKKTPSNIRIYESVETEILNEWFAVADLFLLPSYAEGRPTAIYEAMASKTAVLSTNIEGIDEQVDDGKTGCLISGGDTQALKDTLLHLLDNPDKIRKMGIEGYNRLISEGWTFDAFAERVVETHEKLL